MVPHTEPVPNRVFVDTNIVWHWHTYGDLIADNMDFNEQEVIEKLGRKGLVDMKAFKWIYQVATHEGNIQFVVSVETLEELHRKVHDERGFSRFQWGGELLDWWMEQLVDGEEDFEETHSTAQTWLDHGVLDFLPDSNDRLLVAAAFASHCGIFLTMDYRTILPHRRRLYELAKLRVLRPLHYAREID